LRRIRRRSTMRSASSDMASILQIDSKYILAPGTGIQHPNTAKR
jgi:hypothetical protein